MNFDEYIQEVFGDEVEEFLTHPDIPTFVRVNPLRSTPAKVTAALESYGIQVEPHPLSPLALRISVPEGGSGPGGCFEHYFGSYAPQSLGSMVPAFLLDAQPGERVLDLCSAPGSKLTAIAAAMRGRGQLWSNDYSGKRLPALASSIDRAGAPNISVSVFKGEQLPRLVAGRFDRILADVPCTGFGRREHVSACRSWFDRRGKKSALPEIQYSLLVAAAKLVKVGGRVVYSTCSLSADENEAVVHKLVSRLPLRLVAAPTLPGLKVRGGLTQHGGATFDPSLAKALRLVPWENPTEGFFVAVLEKTDDLIERFHYHEPEAMETTPTLAYDDPEVAPILEELRTTYGYGDKHVGQPGDRFILTRDRIWLLGGDFEEVWNEAERVGLPMANRTFGRWKLNPAVLHTVARAEAITSHTLEVSRAQFTELASAGRTELDRPFESDNPFPILTFEDFGPFATGIVKGSELRWKVPRRYVLPTDPL